MHGVDFTGFSWKFLNQIFRNGLINLYNDEHFHGIATINRKSERRKKMRLLFIWEGNIGAKYILCEQFRDWNDRNKYETNVWYKAYVEKWIWYAINHMKLCIKHYDLFCFRINLQFTILLTLNIWVNRIYAFVS